MVPVPINLRSSMRKVIPAFIVIVTKLAVLGVYGFGKVEHTDTNTHDVVGSYTVQLHALQF